MKGAKWSIPTKDERLRQRLHDFGIGLLVGAFIFITTIVLALLKVI